MTIEPDVKAIATHFGLDPALIQAVVRAEGDIIRAVRCSVPSVTTREQALDVLCRSAVHAMSDFVRAHSPNDFVHAWAKRWAPEGATNDPMNLNANWPRNVIRLWGVDV